MNIEEIKIPDRFYFTRDHEWVLIEKKEAVKVGITDYAQQLLHEIVFVSLPNIGLEIKSKETLGSVESVKTASDVYSPVSGKVVEVNGDLLTSPELVNKDPYGRGWLVALQPTDREAYKALMTAEQYREYVKKLLESAE